MTRPPETSISVGSAASTARMNTGMNRLPLRLPLPRCAATIFAPQTKGNFDTSHHRRWFLCLLLSTVTASLLGAACGGSSQPARVVGSIERCQIREVLTDGVHWVAAADNKACSTTTAISVEYDLTIQKGDGSTYTTAVNFPVAVGDPWPPK